MLTPKTAARGTGRSGLTLVETALSVAIMATMIVMSMICFGNLVRSRVTVNCRMLATSLAGQLASEIIQNGYADPSSPGNFGPEAGEADGTRANFDDVDDYHNFSESPPAQKDGTAIAGLDGWTRQVAVEYLNPDTLASSQTDMGLKKITVTVIDPRKIRTIVTALRSSSGASDQVPAQAISAVRWVGVELQIGADSGNRMVCGTSPMNIVPAGGP